MRDKIAIIAGEFHRQHIEVMLEEARKVAKEVGLVIAKEVLVPGSYEIPLVLKQVMANEDIDGVVVLGIIERGETKHGLVMGQAIMPAIVSLELEYDKPVGIGILGPEILPEQFGKRLKLHAKGAVIAAKKMLELIT